MDRYNYDELENEVSAFERRIMNEYSESVDRFYIYMESGYIYLSDLYIRKDRRNGGIGSRILNELGAFADGVGMDVYCIPSSDDGENGDELLVKFYKKNGYEVIMEDDDGIMRMYRRSGKRR